MEIVKQKKRVSDKLKSESKYVFNETRIIFTEIKNYGIFFKFLMLFLLGFILFYSEYLMEPSYVVLFFRVLFHYYAIHLVFNVAKVVIVGIYKRRYNYGGDYVDNFVLATERVLGLLANIMFLIVALIVIGFDIKSFLTSISIFAVALVLIFKDYISNLLNGMVMMFSQDLKLREIVKVGDIKGRIIDITFMNTEIRTETGDIVFIPNTTMITKEVVNYSKSSAKRISFGFSLGIAFYEYVNELERFVTKNVARDFEGLVKEEDVLIKAVEIKKDEALFSIEVEVSKYNLKIDNEIRNYLSKQVLDFLSKKKKLEKKEAEKK